MNPRIGNMAVRQRLMTNGVSGRAVEQNSDVTNAETSERKISMRNPVESYPTPESGSSLKPI